MFGSLDLNPVLLLALSVEGDVLDEDGAQHHRANPSATIQLEKLYGFVGTRGICQIFRPNKRELWILKTIVMDSTHQQCP